MDAQMCLFSPKKDVNSSSYSFLPNPHIPPLSPFFTKMDRCFCSSSLSFFSLIFLLNLPIPSTASSAAGQSSSSPFTPSSFRYSDIIAKRVRVVVDPIRVVLDEVLANMSKKERPVCILALHRDECHGPRIKPNERIVWQDRLCLVWRCLRADKLAMRVQDCWAGSGKSPILLIDQDGCTRESSMLSTPYYRPLNHSAHSLGWLTVRLPHLDHIRLSCALKFCPICDPFCRQQTPPTQCADSAGRGGEKWWQEKLKDEDKVGKRIGQICGEKDYEEGIERNSGLKDILVGTLICWLGIFIQIIYLLNL